MATAATNRSSISHPTEMHEILITYSGPFHPLYTSYGNLTHKTFCITLEQIISAESILNYLSQKTGWPYNILTLHSNSPLFNPNHSICTHDTTIQIYPPLTATLSNSHTVTSEAKADSAPSSKANPNKPGPASVAISPDDACDTSMTRLNCANLRLCKRPAKGEKMWTN